MNKIETWLLLALLPASAAAQIVPLTPTNYSITIVNQNNTGRWRQSWENNSQDTISLGKRTLMFTHTVYFDSAFSGTKFGGPKLLEDRYTYRQIGGAAYVPIGGELITFFAPRSKGGWIAATNLVPASAMVPVFWVPSFIGSVTTGDDYAHTTTTGSALECSGRNLANLPYLVRIRCAGGGNAFDLLYRFERNEYKPIKVHNDECPWFVFDLDNNDEEAL